MVPALGDTPSPYRHRRQPAAPTRLRVNERRVVGQLAACEVHEVAVRPVAVEHVRAVAGQRGAALHVQQPAGQELAAGLRCSRRRGYSVACSRVTPQIPLTGLRSMARYPLAIASRSSPAPQPHLPPQLPKLLRHGADQEATGDVPQHVLGVGLGAVELLVLVLLL